MYVKNSRRVKHKQFIALARVVNTYIYAHSQEDVNSKVVLRSSIDHGYLKYQSIFKIG